jgi:hypothetical protein
MKICLLDYFTNQVWLLMAGIEPGFGVDGRREILVNVWGRIDLQRVQGGALSGLTYIISILID